MLPRCSWASRKYRFPSTIQPRPQFRRSSRSALRTGFERYEYDPCAAMFSVTYQVLVVPSSEIGDWWSVRNQNQEHYANFTTVTSLDVHVFRFINSELNRTNESFKWINANRDAIHDVLRSVNSCNNIWFQFFESFFYIVCSDVAFRTVQTS